MFWIKCPNLSRREGDNLGGLEWWVPIVWDDQDDVVLGMSLVVKGNVLWLIRIYGRRNDKNLVQCPIGDLADWTCSQTGKEWCCKWFHHTRLLYCTLEEA